MRGTVGRAAWILLHLAAGGAALAPATGLAQPYPDRPLRFVIPFPPGGGADNLARIVGQKVGDNLHQQIVIDNRSGAGGNVGTEIAARSPADGYTLLMANVAPMAINVSLHRKLPYDPIKDLVHVPYKGGGPALIDLVAGQVTLYFGSMPASLPHIRSGRLRALGVTSPQRSAAAPDIPSVAESGFPGFDAVTWVNP